MSFCGSYLKSILVAWYMVEDKEMEKAWVDYSHKKSDSKVRNEDKQ